LKKMMSFSRASPVARKKGKTRGTSADQMKKGEKKKGL